MSFLSLAFLAALPLALAPVVLHLIDRQRNVVIQWGAMQFLMEAATKRTQARRLRERSRCCYGSSRRPCPGVRAGSTDRACHMVPHPAAAGIDRGCGTIHCQCIPPARRTNSTASSRGARARSPAAAPHPGQTSRVLMDVTVSRMVTGNREFLSEDSCQRGHAGNHSCDRIPRRFFGRAGHSGASGTRSVGDRTANHRPHGRASH